MIEVEGAMEPHFEGVSGEGGPAWLIRAIGCHGATYDDVIAKNFVANDGGGILELSCSGSQGKNLKFTYCRSGYVADAMAVSAGSANLGRFGPSV